MNREEQLNRDHWNEVAEIHYRSYHLDALRQGKPLLDEIILREVGDVRGKSLLHLQCHIGSDTLSWVHLGAEVTGVDFSEVSIELAKRLSNECNLQANWIVSDIFSLPEKHSQLYDVVFATEGVICWISDMKRWMQVAARFLKPGGVFYLMDSHPMTYNIFDREQPDYKITNSYFSNPNPIFYRAGSDYSDGSYTCHVDNYEWIWSLGDIITAAAQAGLRIEFLHEYDTLFYCEFPYMLKTAEGRWKHPLYQDMLPQTFSLRATK